MPKKKTILKNDFVDALDKVFCELRSMLIMKNAKYGNSALKPRRVFSSSDAIEQLNVRIDDKLSRISNATQNHLTDDEDAELDLLGYLILKRIGRRKFENPEFNLEIVE